MTARQQVRLSLFMTVYGEVPVSRQSPVMHRHKFIAALVFGINNYRAVHLQTTRSSPYIS